MSKFQASAWLGGSLLAAAALLAPTAHSATRYVSASSVTTLHRWFDSADVYTSNNYVISLTSTTPYTLAKTLKLTKGYVTLNGGSNLTGAPNYTLEAGYPNGSNFKRVLDVQGLPGWMPSIDIRGVTLRGGWATDGGGVYVKNGYVTLTDSYILENSASSRGSGIYVGSNTNVNLINCVVQKNINWQSQKNLCGGVTAGGGGVSVEGGVLYSHRSTFMENQSCRGAAVAVYSGFATFESSTISSNNANKRGGAFYITGAPWVNLKFNTIAYNKAGTHQADPSGFYEEKYGGGIAMSGFTGTLEMFGNILAKNQTVFSDKATLSYHGHDCHRRSPSLPTFRHMDNLIGAVGNCVQLHSGGPPFHGTETNPVDPLLGSLTLKAGTSGNQYTHALQNGSWAIKMFWYNSAWGNYAPVYCPYADQLGHRRDWWEPEAISPKRCDMGAQVYNWYH